MSKPFDATTMGVQAAEVEVIDADLSTVTAAADKLIRVLSPAPWLVNLERMY
ncbi:MAG: hypothetical protein NZT92_11910 [Abditibacteriales bacterium]|nr:hypothetical protein [Abditibacteriales bacterium]MDW8366670.1 hypothetical protein [Abditibacteriales bacterium]